MRHSTSLSLSVIALELFCSTIAKTMPITEILVPQLNTSPECIKVFNETWPTIGRQAFATRPSIDSQYQGWILSEDNKDVQNEHKYLILLGANKSSFDHFPRHC